MQKPQFIVVQSWAEYERERQRRIDNRLFAIKCMVLSGLFTLLFFIIFSLLKIKIEFENFFWIFLIFLGLFLWSDITKSPTVRAVTQTLFGVLYGLWGVFLLIVVISAIFMLDASPIDGMALSVYVLVGICFYFSYKRINEHTHLFKSGFLHKLKDLFRNLLKPKGSHPTSNNSNLTIKRIALWLVTFFIGVFLAKYLLSVVYLKNKIVVILFVGLIVEIVSKIMQKIVWKKNFNVNRYFLFWTLIHALGFWIASLSFGKISGVVQSYVSQALVLNNLDVFWTSVLLLIIANVLWYFQVDKKILGNS
jgi:hypothetical protein